MALWICKGCTAAYSVGASCCPQCGSTKSVEEGSRAHLAMLDKAAPPATAETSSIEASGAEVPDA